jgi:hypothetical protein
MGIFRRCGPPISGRDQLTHRASSPLLLDVQEGRWRDHAAAEAHHELGGDDSAHVAGQGKASECPKESRVLPVAGPAPAAPGAIGQ